MPLHVFFLFFFYFILFSSCVNKSYCICSLKFGICHICIQKTASLSFKNYDPPCHYNKGQVTLMCQQLSDYVVGSYTKCVNKRRYISWTLGEIPAPIDHIQCSRHSVKMAKTQVYCGMFVHSTKKDYMRILQNHAIGVKEGKVGININSMCLYNLLWSCRTKSLSEVFS